MIVTLALAVISAAVLAYEVLLVRLFAIVQWHHFAFMAISIALLGFGISGTLLTIARDWVRSRFTLVFASGALLFAVCAPASFLLVQVLPFNPLAVVWDPAQLFYLPAMYLLLGFPFICGATCIGIAFHCHGKDIGRIYASNLTGSAVGAFGAIGVLFALSPSEALRLIAALGFVGAAVIGLNGKLSRWPVLSVGSLVLAAVVWTGLPDAWFALRMSEYKALPSTLGISGAKVVGERSGPLGLLSVVESPQVPFRYVPGLSLNTPALPPAQLGVFTDGDSMTAITRFAGRREDLTYLDYTTDAVAYHLLGQPSVLVLGAGGGRGVLQALYQGAKRIDAVELDRNMVRLVKEDFAEMAGHIYSRPEVRVYLAEARGFAAASREQWDLLQMPLLGGFGAAAPGLHGLNETYLYTVEAFERYLGRLRPGGWISLTRWLKLPPRDALKLFATALARIRHKRLPPNPLYAL